MGLTEYLLHHPGPIRPIGVEAYNAPKYARFTHARTATIADGLVLEVPHAKVQERIGGMGLTVEMVRDPDIRAAVTALFRSHGLLVEPSSAAPIAWLQTHVATLEEPICVVLTGENIAREDFYRLVGSIS
jgi:threonine dehydratase